MLPKDAKFVANHAPGFNAPMPRLMTWLHRSAVNSSLRVDDGWLVDYLVDLAGPTELSSHEDHRTTAPSRSRTSTPALQ